MSDPRNQTKVSVIVPTRNRAHLLPQLIEHFNQQTWSNKELLILDDTPGGEAAVEKLCSRYPHVRLWYSGETLSIGAKRNQLLEHASGELVAHFDDDDYYAPTYLESMALELLKSNSDLVKLAGWFCFHEASETLGYWDTTRQDLPHTIFEGREPPKLYDKTFTTIGYRSFLTGYGFSYLYRKQTWEKTKFKNINLGEDSLFHEEVLKKQGKTKALQDTSGICIHIIHKNNTSRCFPNHIIPNCLKKTYAKNIALAMRKQLKTEPPKPRGQEAKRNHTAFYPTKTEWSKDAPMVSICTLTHNRHHLLPLLQHCIENQDYPHAKIEWLILDDSTEQPKDTIIKPNTNISIKYQRVKTKLTLGKKRNLSHQLCSGDYIIYMDDDDFYYPTRVSHAVSSLQQSGKAIAGCTLLQIYFCHDQQLWISGPFGRNHATAGTFAMSKEFARTHFYNNEDIGNEEKHFLEDYTIPMVQLDPCQTMICISHKANTFDKKKMRHNHETPRMKQINPTNLSNTTANMLSLYQKIHLGQAL